jgi:hypothetical protein
MPSVAQILSFLVDFGMDLDGAFHTPRSTCQAQGVRWWIVVSATRR